MKYSNGHHSLLIKRSDLVITGDQILDGATCEEFIPATWDGFHAGRRIADAFGVLRRFPMKRGPQIFGTLWPAFAAEYADRSQYEDDAQWKRDRAEEQAQRRQLPSAIEIAQMEAGISWPPRYLADYPQLLRTVGMIALWKSRDADVDFIAKRKLKLPPHVARKWNEEGLSVVARGLVKDRIRVF